MVGVVVLLIVIMSIKSDPDNLKKNWHANFVASSARLLTVTAAQSASTAIAIYKVKLARHFYNLS